MILISKFNLRKQGFLFHNKKWVIIEVVIQQVEYKGVIIHQKMIILQ
jgi:hypothetical protein